MVLSGSRIWSAGHEDDRICFGRPVGSCRDRWLCQRFRHEDLLGATGTPVLLSIFLAGPRGHLPRGSSGSYLKHNPEHEAEYDLIV